MFRRTFHICARRRRGSRNGGRGSRRCRAARRAGLVRPRHPCQRPQPLAGARRSSSRCLWRTACASSASSASCVRPTQRCWRASRASPHLGGELADFADTAAVLALADLVICVDTSVAHLAGALGRPVWVLLPFQPDWRWTLDGETQPLVSGHAAVPSVRARRLDQRHRRGCVIELALWD